MKTLTTLFALAILSATAYGQTIKSLGYNTTNGEVVANTGTNVLRFTNSAIEIGQTNSDITSITPGEIASSFGFRLNWEENFIEKPGATFDFRFDEVRLFGSLSFGGDEATTNAAITRTNLGLGGGVITNIDVLVSGGGTNTLQFSNGILTNVTTP
jgi:hypothetical protein